MSQIVSASEFLNREQRAAVQKKHAGLGWLSIAGHYGLIAAAFALVYWWFHPVSIVLSLFILGGQQLGSAILMHDTSHYAVFKSRRLNHIVGQWLGAYPILHNLSAYRPYHYQHHIKNGLPEDPDRRLTTGYPTTRLGLLRKFSRDLFGITGIKSVFALVAMHLGFLEYNLGGKVAWIARSERTWNNFWIGLGHIAGALATNAVLWSALNLVDAPWLYLLWAGAYLTTFQFCLRVRAMAEHSMVVDQSDPYQNTRTTYANVLERVLFAPYWVNYHAEHHMLMTAPSYRLRLMHRWLMEAGYYQRGVRASGYLSVVRAAIHPAK